MSHRAWLVRELRGDKIQCLFSWQVTGSLAKVSTGGVKRE